MSSVLKNRGFHPINILSQISIVVKIWCFGSILAGVTSCEILDIGDGDKKPVATEVAKQADQLKKQSEELAQVAQQMKKQAKELEKQYSEAQERADEAKTKWKTMEDQAAEMQKQADVTKKQAESMKKQAAVLEK